MTQMKYGLALFSLAFAGAVLAEDLPEFNGGDLVVTASGVPQPAGIAPVSVTVVTARDIANSTAATVQDVLSTQAGVHVYNMGGQSPVIDLRGFGITGISNTLILVDGAPQSTNDLSPPDLGYIPLSSIERIEIVRGSGAVQYGGGATGGVINIITKAGYQAQNRLSITQKVGSFSTRETDVSFNLAGSNGVSLDGFAQSMNSDHYRQNSAERNDGGGLGVNWKFDEGSARLYVRSSSDRQGLPGSLTEAQYQSSPSSSNYLLNWGYEKTDVAGFQGNFRLGAGQVYLDLASRDKTTRSAWVSSPWYDQRTVNEDTGSVRYVLPFAKNNQWMFGTDWLYSDATDRNSTSSLDTVLTADSTKQRHQGLFTEGQLDLWSGARLTVGGRAQRIADITTCTANGISSGSCSDTSQEDKELHAWQIGLRQALANRWSVYVKQGESFRLANADELGYAAGPILPQTSLDHELGIEWAGGAASARLAVFRSDLNNEIGYVPYVNGGYGYNMNLSPTRHQGIELGGSLSISPAWQLDGNLTWQQATFRSGVYNGYNLAGDRIPMVPSLLANLGLSWAVSETVRANLEAQFVGSQIYDNDQDNQFGRKLGSYTLVNAKLTDQFNRHWSGSVGVNNLLNRQYATYATLSSGAPRFYPADPRNYHASVTWSF